VLIWTFRW